MSICYRKAYSVDIYNLDGSQYRGAPTGTTRRGRIRPSLRCCASTDDGLRGTLAETEATCIGDAPPSSHYTAPPERSVRLEVILATDGLSVKD